MARIVLYAEGRGETGLSAKSASVGSRRIPTDAEGAAHILIRRLCRERLAHDEREIQLELPLRYKGREPAGADLLNRAVLRQLLTWPEPRLQPDVVIVLVDQDGDALRRDTLRHIVESLRLQFRAIIGVAVEEFEAWLIADHAAVMRIADKNEQQGRAPESLAPGESKRRLQQLLSTSPRDARVYDLRCEVARAVDLALVLEQCRSFKRFFDEIKQAMSQRK